jgi:DNA/RNA-binding domain of Phe-tRNA-synthetase-like protein
MTIFQYNSEIIQNFSKIHAALVIGRGIKVKPSPPPLQEIYLAEQKKAVIRYQNIPISEIPSLEAWRKAFRRFGVNPTKYRSAPEALLRRLLKKGSLPFINSVVDICNLVSIRYAIPVASLDNRRVSGAITVRFSKGNEWFTPLGTDQAVNPEVGEVIFTDDIGLVVARRWCWRQSRESATTMDSHQFLITIEGLHSSAARDVQSALQDVLKLLAEFVPGKYHSGALDAERTFF